MTPVDPRAIEAAARAEYEHTEHETWDQAHPDDRADWLETARVALEAAAPILMTEAWSQGAEHAWAITGEGWNAEYAGGNDAHPTFPHLEDNPYLKPQ